MAETTPPRRQERVTRAERDRGSADELVAVQESCVGGRYAYHIPDSTAGLSEGDTAELACNSAQPESEYVLRPREWAHQRWMSPCQICREWNK